MTGEMLKMALEQSGKPPKAVAKECGYSVDAIYAAVNGKRKVPYNARGKISGINILAGMAVALEATGYKKLFMLFKGDRHPQTLIRKAEKEAREADEAIRKLPWVIMDKDTPEDLAEGEQRSLCGKCVEIIESSCANLNLVAELNNRYNLDLAGVLAGKIEKALGVVAEPRGEYKTT